MTALNLSGFLAQTSVTISFDLSSSLSNIPPSVVHTLDLAANLCRDSGRPNSRRLLPSRLGLVYSLPADVVLGTDWILPCQPVLGEDHTILRRPHQTP